MRTLRGSSLEWTARTEEVPLRELIAVPVDVGKSSAMVMACDFTGRVLLPAVEFALTREGVAQMLARVQAAVPARAQLVRVGVEAAGHYHLPMIAAGVWPDGWQVVELNPAHVSAQRAVNGQRGVKTDRVDLVAIADLLLAGRGFPVVACGEPLIELAAWVAHRRRRGEVRTAMKNQLLTQLDRAFPASVPGAGGRAGHQGGPAGGRALRRSCPAGPAGPGPVPRVRCAPRRAGTCPSGRRTAGAGGPCGPPTAQAFIARQILHADLAFLGDLEGQITAAEQRIAALLPGTEYHVLTTVPGWGVTRAASYAAALGPFTRWGSPAKVYRAAGLTPSLMHRPGGAATAPSAGKLGPPAPRPDRPGIGLWQKYLAARGYAPALRERGKPGGIIACALAHRAGKIAFAMVRDQTPYDPARWS